MFATDRVPPLPPNPSHSADKKNKDVYSKPQSKVIFTMEKNVFFFIFAGFDLSLYFAYE